LLQTHACDETNKTILEMERNVPGFSMTEIPQLEDISQFLIEKTGWRMKPVGGLLTQREFLNALAFKIFHSTQYIRHHDTPEYTPEPDIIHELVGHAPMFAH
jgi:phenylalanine-4-hydroxylase